jgi:hypothetical protein
MGNLISRLRAGAANIINRITGRRAASARGGCSSGT